MGRYPESAPGPFRASQIHEGDPYELSNGHPIRCMTAGGRHGGAHTVGSRVLDTDPAVTGKVGIDVGIAWNDDKNLRAPDIVVGALERVPGWQRTLPPLAVEYADTGQDEAGLQEKIAELLAAGTKVIWVVRLVGPLRVEVYERETAVRVFGADDELTAPGILQNSVPVRALVEPEAATAVMMRNLLGPYGYRSVEELAARTRADGIAESLLAVLAARGLVPSDAQVAEIRGCRDAAVLQRWLTRAAVADAIAAVFA